MPRRPHVPFSRLHDGADGRIKSIALWVGSAMFCAGIQLTAAAARLLQYLPYAHMSNYFA